MLVYLSDDCPFVLIIMLLFCLVKRVGYKPGRQRSGTVSWVLHDELGAHYLFSPVIKLCIKKQRKNYHGNPTTTGILTGRKQKWSTRKIANL